MKFNIGLSTEDQQSHKAILEEHLSIYESDVRIIHSDIVHKCMDIFINTFRDEICPKCRTGLLKANHMSYYNMIQKRCDACGHITGRGKQ